MNKLYICHAEGQDHYLSILTYLYLSLSTDARDSRIHHLSFYRCERDSRIHHLSFLQMRERFQNSSLEETETKLAEKEAQLSCLITASPNVSDEDTMEQLCVMESDGNKMGSYG